MFTYQSVDTPPLSVCLVGCDKCQTWPLTICTGAQIADKRFSSWLFIGFRSAMLFAYSQLSVQLSLTLPGV